MTSSPAAAVPYFATEAHYLSLAGRLAAALQDGGLVLVTGDPSANPQLLSEALRKVARARRMVIDISCSSELEIEQLSRACCAGRAAPAPALFVFDEVDRLSDQQVAQTCKAFAQRAGESAAAVLLSRGCFSDRLEAPLLQPVKEALAARFRLDEIGEDESIDFLRHQLQTRYRDDEKRSIRDLPCLGRVGSGGDVGGMRSVGRASHRHSPPDDRHCGSHIAAACRPAAGRRAGDASYYRARADNGCRAGATDRPRRLSSRTPVSCGHTALFDRNRSAGIPRRRFPQGGRHRVGAPVLRAGCRCGQRLGGAAVGRDIRSRLSRQRRRAGHSRGPGAGGVVVYTCPRSRRSRRRAAPEEPRSHYTMTAAAISSAAFLTGARYGAATDGRSRTAGLSSRRGKKDPVHHSAAEETRDGEKIWCGIRGRPLPANAPSVRPVDKTSAREVPG